MADLHDGAGDNRAWTQLGLAQAFFKQIFETLIHHKYFLAVRLVEVELRSPRPTRSPRGTAAMA
jgi:hypothetical protein